MFWAIVAAGSVAVLGVVYFAIRFWLVSTRPVNIRDIPTPTLDRLNQQALERMGDDEWSEDATDDRCGCMDEDEAAVGKLESGTAAGKAAICLMHDPSGPNSIGHVQTRIFR